MFTSFISFILAPLTFIDLILGTLSPNIQNVLMSLVVKIFGSAL